LAAAAAAAGLGVPDSRDCHRCAR